MQGRMIVQLDCGNEKQKLGALESREVSALHDSLFDHLLQIGALIAAARGIKDAHGYTYLTWEVSEPELKLIRTSAKGNVRSSNQNFPDFGSAHVPMG